MTTITGATCWQLSWYGFPQSQYIVALLLLLSIKGVTMLSHRVACITHIRGDYPQVLLYFTHPFIIREGMGV